MVKFKNLSDMQAWLEKNTMQVLKSSKEFEQVLAEFMSRSVEIVVYDAYDPVRYERRMDDGGLSDIRNMEIDNVSVVGGKILVTMINITTGNDSMAQRFISDLIIEGLESTSGEWNNPNGAWVDKRDYITHAMESLKNNPEELLNVLKSGMLSKGLKVK